MAGNTAVPPSALDGAESHGRTFLPRLLKSADEAERRLMHRIELLEALGKNAKYSIP